MTQRNRLMEGVRTLCGEPPDAPLSEGGLPSNLIFEELANLEVEMLRDLDLSTQNRRVQMEEIPLGSGDESFLPGAGNFQAPTYAHLRIDSLSDYWYPVELTTYEALAEATAANRLAIAFSGSPLTGYFSWLPDGSQTLRLWYERSDVDEPVLSGETELASLYDEYLKLQCAAQCREHLKLEIGGMMRARLERSSQQWKRYVNRAYQRGNAAKAPVFTPPRRRRSFIDRTRYFIP